MPQSQHRHLKNCLKMFNIAAISLTQMLRICVFVAKITIFPSFHLKNALTIFFTAFYTKFAQIWICYLSTYSYLLYLEEAVFFFDFIFFSHLFSKPSKRNLQKTPHNFENLKTKICLRITHPKLCKFCVRCSKKKVNSNMCFWANNSWKLLFWLPKRESATHVSEKEPI